MSELIRGTPPGPEVSIHPFSKILPEMDVETYAVLKERMATEGQRVPIIINSSNQVIDGRHRYRACQELGIDPLLERRPLTDAEALALVFDVNVVRRHMNEAQRASAGARYRQAANLPQRRVAELMNVSLRTLRDAERVMHASPDLHAALLAGKLSVLAAASVLKQPEEDRPRLIDELLTPSMPRSSSRTRTLAARASGSERVAERASPTARHAYTPLFGALAELPLLLVDYPLPAEDLHKLQHALKQALELIESAASS